MTNNDILLSINDIWQQTRELSCKKFGSVVYPPDGHYYQPEQAHLQLFLLHNGSLRVTIDGRCITVSPPAFFFMVPGSEYRFEFTGPQGTWHTWIDFQGQPDGADWAPLGRFPVPLAMDSAMQDIVEQLLRNRSGAEKPDLVIRDALSLALLGMALSRADVTRNSSSPHPAVARARSCILTRYREDLDLNQIAEAAMIAPAYLSRLFHAETGTTPIRFLWKIRVEHAVVLLERSGLSLTQIAEQTGFKSLYHFSRKVRELSGRSPSAWRNTGK